MTKTTPKSALIACTFAVLTIPMAAVAQNGPPPRPALDKMAAALGVSEAAMTTCMPRPAEGERPERGQRPERPDVAAIATCLRTENASITAASVGDALEAFRPERPARGN